MTARTAALLATAVLGAAPAFAWAQTAEDNGTDPTKIRSQASVSYEHVAALDGVSNDTLKLIYATPLATHTGLQLTLPYVSNDAFGRDGYGFGDVGVKLNHLAKVTRQYGLVVQGEVTFDTADRPELGAGQTVFQGTTIYARFLKGGAIFAPSFQQTYGFNPQNDRARQNSTTLDFYYVPKFRDPALFMTVDPALNFDWESDGLYPALAVTVGRVLGPAFGGKAQAYIKPSVLAGGDRPADWSIEAGFKVIGF